MLPAMPRPPWRRLLARVWSLTIGATILAVRGTALALRTAWRGWRATWRGRHGQAGGARLVAVCLTLGFLLGCAVMWLSAQAPAVRYVLYGDQRELPKPVTDPPPGTRWTKVLTTGYCPCAICCEGSADGVTSIGRRVSERPFGIASDPGLVPPRLMLDVPGYGRAEVDDTGGAMRASAKRGVVHLDLRFTDHATARAWGVRVFWIAMPVTAPAAK